MKSKYKYKFNSERYAELRLKSTLSLLDNNKILNESEQLELSDYSKQFFNYLWWQEKDDFLLFIEKFIDFELESEDFELQFFHRWKAKQQLLVSASQETHKEVEFQFNKILQNVEFDAFIQLVNNISVACTLFEGYDDKYESDEYDDESDQIDYRFRQDIIKAYQEYQKLLVYNSAIDTEIVSEPNLLKGSRNFPRIEEIGLEMKNSDNSNSNLKIYQDSEVLNFVMAFLTILISVVYSFLNPGLFDLF